MLQARSEIDNLEGLSISLGKKLPYKILWILEVGVLVAVANYLDGLILILRGKGFLTIITAMKQRKK